jgi:rubredoxin
MNMMSDNNGGVKITEYKEGDDEVAPLTEIDLSNETEEEKYKREKLAEIAEKKKLEVFMTRDTGNWECQACGYVYTEAKGYAKFDVAPGTPFASIEKFRCPQCGASKKYFVQETETLSGFKENLKYGFGGNGLTGGQKANLIYGGLFLGFIGKRG